MRGLAATGYQPLPSRPARLRAPATSPPTQIGACGSCFVFGAKSRLSKAAYDPRWTGLSAVHSSLNALMYSSDAFARSANGGPPSSAISSDIQPTPTPTVRRPFERTSTVASLGRKHRMTVREHEYRGEQSNTGGCGSGKTKGGHLFKRDACILSEEFPRLGIRICALDLGRDDYVVAHTKVFVAERLRFLGHCPQGVGVADDTARAKMKAEFHCASFNSNRASSKHAQVAPDDPSPRRSPEGKTKLGAPKNLQPVLTEYTVQAVHQARRRQARRPSAFLRRGRRVARPRRSRPDR